MRPAYLTRTTLSLILVAFLAGGFALGSAVTVLGDSGASPSPRPTPSAADATSTPSSLPRGDVDGEDLERLPRFPGSVRTEYEITVGDRYRLTAVEYLADATMDQVRAFYQKVIDDHGWDRADVNYAGGDWTYVLVDGRVEALVEIEASNGLVEIDLQISEPVTTPRPDPTPEPTRRPTPAPAATLPPPPPPPTDGDDDDDDGDDDDWTDWSASDG